MSRRVSTLRWLVRREVAREPKFGETQADVLRWAVRPYRVDPKTGERILEAPTYLRSLPSAHSHAQDRCAGLYGCAHRATHHHRTPR